MQVLYQGKSTAAEPVCELLRIVMRQTLRQRTSLDSLNV